MKYILTTEAAKVGFKVKKYRLIYTQAIIGGSVEHYEVEDPAGFRYLAIIETTTCGCSVRMEVLSDRK
jgi:hypothetical protein